MTVVCLDERVFDGKKWNPRFVKLFQCEADAFVTASHDAPQLKLSPQVFQNDTKQKKSGRHTTNRGLIEQELAKKGKLNINSNESRMEYAKGLAERAQAWLNAMPRVEVAWRLLARVCTNLAVYDGGKWNDAFLAIVSLRGVRQCTRWCSAIALGCRHLCRQ